MTSRLGVGVIGLGVGWRKRYRPILLALRDQFQVRAVYDSCEATAREEARQFSCGVVAGPTALLAREEVDAVLMPDPQWFGLWPIEAACRFRKPVLCGVSLELDDAHADRLEQLVSESRLPVMMETLPGLARLTGRLGEILDAGLGQPRLVLCQWTSPGARVEVQRPGILPLLNWCSSLLKQEPESIVAGGSENGEFVSMLLHFDNGRAAQIIHHLAPGIHSRLVVRIVAERGSASLVLPDRIRWTNSQGRHSHTLTRDKPHTEKMLSEFYRVVKKENDPCPSLAERIGALHWLRAARRSWREGRRIDLRS